MRTIILCLAVTLALALPASAEIERQHDAHVHGEAELKLALDGGALELELELPGMDAVGFEHPPRDAAQKAAIAEAIADLEAAAWINLPTSARCTLMRGEFHTHGYDVADTHTDQHADHAQQGPHDAGHASDQGHHRDHEHEHDHPPSHASDAQPRHDAHAGFHGTLQYDCTRPGALAAIEIDLGSRFPALLRLTVLSISEHGQGRAVLANARGRATLAR
ncbi:MAG TPA: DUF2796 domain-containing protein [Xanthomonadaceae bacterium]|nr:DUF2796 domain-containing protein [Xanthomonadaceae bacterium]